MSAHNHDEEIKKQFGGNNFGGVSLNQVGDLNYPGEKPHPPKPAEPMSVHSVWVDGKYMAEEIANSSNHWNVHFYEPITGSFLSHMQRAKGIDAAQNQTRHSLLVQVARMYQGEAAEVIAAAIESFKE